jgi:hypothetical protein
MEMGFGVPVSELRTSSQQPLLLGSRTNSKLRLSWRCLHKAGGDDEGQGQYRLGVVRRGRELRGWM